MRQTQETNRQALTFSLLLTGCMLFPVLLAALWPPPPGISPPWDWANGLGFLALAICLTLFVYKGRARRFPPYSGRFFANLHRDLGYIVLLLLISHAGILLVQEPLLLEHLKPTAPLHMMSGLLALLLLVMLVTSSVPVLRRRLWPDYHLFRHIHALVSVAIVALSAWHVWGSGFYLNRWWKLALAAAAGVGILAYYSRGKYRTVAPSASRTRDSAGYSHVISYGSAVLAALVCLVLVLGTDPE